MEPTDRKKYDPRIDVLRAFACGMVAVVHFSVPTWTNPIPDRRLVIDTVVLGLIHTGWLGVPLFLFLSGFSLALNKTHEGYDLDKKQFFLNRFLRIFPAWIACVLILTLTHKLSGINVVTLMLLQMQDLPPANAFNLAWSLQLEFMCYLLFPVFLSAVSQRKGVLPLYCFLLLVRVWMYMIPTPMMMQLSYGTVFGGATIFLTGIYAASLPPIRDQRTARGFLAVGIALFCIVAVFVWKSGGYQAPKGRLIHWFFLIMPEVLSAIVLLIVRGTITQISDAPRPSASSLHRIFATAKDGIFAILTHFGRVSYSAYLFSLFTLDFTSRVFPAIKPSGWLSLIAALAMYFVALTAFSTAAFYGVELPFLQMRRRYVHAAPKS